MGVTIYTYRNVRTGEVTVRPERSARLDSKPDVWELQESEPTQEPKVERVKKAAPKAKSRSSSQRSTGRKTSSK